MNIERQHTKALIGSVNAGNDFSTYPEIFLVSQVKWSYNIFIHSIQYSGSVLCTQYAGMIITIGNQPTKISVSEGMESQISHISAPNFYAGSSRVPDVQVFDKVYKGKGYYLEAGQPVNLYAFTGASDPNTVLLSISSIDYLPASDCG